MRDPIHYMVRADWDEYSYVILAKDLNSEYEAEIAKTTADRLLDSFSDYLSPDDIPTIKIVEYES